MKQRALMIVAALIALAVLAIGGAYVTQQMDNSEEPSQKSTRTKPAFG